MGGTLLHYSLDPMTVCSRTPSLKVCVMCVSVEGLEKKNIKSRKDFGVKSVFFHLRNVCTSEEQVHDRAEGLKKSCWALRRSWRPLQTCESWLQRKLRLTWMCFPKWLGPRSSAPSQNTPPSDGPGRPGARTPPCDAHTREKRETQRGERAFQVSKGSREGVQAAGRDCRREVESLHPL